MPLSVSPRLETFNIVVTSINAHKSGIFLFNARDTFLGKIWWKQSKLPVYTKIC